MASQALGATWLDCNVEAHDEHLNTTTRIRWVFVWDAQAPALWSYILDSRTLDVAKIKVTDERISFGDEQGVVDAGSYEAHNEIDRRSLRLSGWHRSHLVNGIIWITRYDGSCAQIQPLPIQGKQI
jgi:hypothetical protein